MASNRPRLPVPLSHETHALYKRYSELTGKSAAALISEMVEASAPHVRVVVQMLEDATKAAGSLDDKLRAEVSRRFEHLEAQAAFALGGLSGQMDWAAEPLKPARKRGRPPKPKA